MKPALSIVIVSWNVRNLLGECLTSLYRSIQRLSLQIIVVDNASTDGTQEMVRTHFEDVHLIANCENVGFGRANNQGLELCRGRYVLFLNPDTYVPDGSIEEMVRFLENHPGIGMVGPELPNGEGRLLWNWSRYSVRGIAEFLIERLVSALTGRRPLVLFDRPYIVPWLTGACWLVRRRVIQRIGAFDEHLFLYGEEPDVCYRLRKAGWKICFLRHARIVHYKGQSMKQAARSLPWFWKSITYVFAKNARDWWADTPLAQAGGRGMSRR
jgi:GT2 family glycosyltransferase